MLRKLRISVAVIFFALITLLFLDFTGTIHAWFGWMAKIQFLPAVLALNVGVVLLLLILTLTLGRVYCSVICPLGIFQDLVSRISGSRKKKKYRFTYSPALTGLRYGVLALFIVALVAGIGSLVALLAPYSSYGRIVSSLFVPIYQWGNNLLAYGAERVNSYAFYRTEVWVKSVPVLGITMLTFIVISILSWRNGRTYCNTICPVGTVLGLLSRYSLLRPVIDTTKCNQCSLCSRQEEKTVNLAIALFVREKLEAAGYPVKMIRETDTAVGDTTLSTLNERKRSDILYRTQIVNETENCIFVSIHQNFFEQSQYSGAQMFYSANNAKSADLAETIRRAVIEQVQPDNTRACKQAESRVYILSHVDVPAVFAECGFLSNPEEAEKLCNENYQKKLAAAIADGIIAFCKAE